MIELHPWDPRENLKTADDMASYLDTILAHDGHWGGVYALSDIADAMGEKRVIPEAWRIEKSVYKAEKRGDVLDFAAFMNMARALGLRLYADAAKTRRLTQSPNGKSTQDLASPLNAALDRCDAWGAALALRDIAEASGMESAVPDGWESAASVRESEKRGDTPDFAAFMDAARALGMRLHAAVARSPERLRGRGATIVAARD